MITTLNTLDASTGSSIAEIISVYAGLIDAAVAISKIRGLIASGMLSADRTKSACVGKRGFEAFKGTQSTPY